MCAGLDTSVANAKSFERARLWIPLVLNVRIQQRYNARSIICRIAFAVFLRASRMATLSTLRVRGTARSYHRAGLRSRYASLNSDEHFVEYRGFDLTSCVSVAVILRLPKNIYPRTFI